MWKRITSRLSTYVSGRQEHWQQQGETYLRHWQHKQAG